MRPPRITDEMYARIPALPAESRYQMIQTELRHLRLRSARARQPEAIKRYEARIALLEAEAASLFH